MGIYIIRIISAILWLIFSFLVLIAFGIPIFFAAWLLTVLFPYDLSQTVWLSVGTVIVTGFIIEETLSKIEHGGYNLERHIITITVSYITLVTTNISAWLLAYLPLDISMFEIVMVLTVTLLGGMILLSRNVEIEDDQVSWLFKTNELDDDIIEEDDDVITPSKRRKRRRSRG